MGGFKSSTFLRIIRVFYHKNDEPILSLAFSKSPECYVRVASRRNLGISVSTGGLGNRALGRAPLA